MTDTKLVVVIGSNTMSQLEHSAFMSLVKVVADVAGVELLVVRDGQSADEMLSRGAQVAQGEKAKAQAIKDGLRRCACSREAFHRAGLSTGIVQIEATTAQLREELDSSNQPTSIIHAWGRDSTGRPRMFSDEVKAAMRLLESLINAGDIALAPDRWCEGRMRFTGAPLRDIDKPDEQVSTVTPIHGEAMSFALDPLEQAIESTTRVMRDELDHMAHISRSLEGNVPTTAIYNRMGDHLDALLAAQLKRVTADE